MAATDWRTELRQAATIARATFGGFLQSDIMPQGLQASAVIWAAAFLAAPTLLLSAQGLSKYALLQRYMPHLVERNLWSDRALFILLSCGSIGLVCVITWDTLFPMRRDVFVLGPLPVSQRVQAVGRLGGLFALFAAFAAALNVVPAVIFSMSSALHMDVAIRGIPAHLAACVAADAFVFFTLTTVQGVLLVFFSRRAAERVAPILQTFTVVAVLLGLLFIDVLRAATAEALQRGDVSDPFLRWFPLSWFLGIYELLAGTTRPIMAWLALQGVLWAVIPLSITVGLYVFAFRRLCARALETQARSASFPLSRLASKALRHVFVRHPVEQAICAFTLRVFARSRRHRMLMAIYVGSALALIAAVVLPLIVNPNPASLARPNANLLSPPLILSAALAVGFRALLAIPVDLPARWLFRTCSLTPMRIGGGVHKAGLLVAVLPVTVTAWISAATLWGTSIAWQHTLFCTVLSVLLLEILLLRFGGVPFARQYVPGSSRFHMLWPIYMTAFLTYTYSAAAAERDLLRDGGLSGALIFLGILAMSAAIARVWSLWNAPELSFDVEIPDEMFQGFNLSEGVAAHAVATRHASGSRA